MSKTTEKMIAKKQAEIKAAEVISAALVQARTILATADHDDAETAIAEIIEAELE